MTLRPDFATRVWEAEGCAPLRLVGPEVDRVGDALVKQAIKTGGSSRRFRARGRIRHWRELSGGIGNCVMSLINNRENSGAPEEDRGTRT